MGLIGGAGMEFEVEADGLLGVVDAAAEGGEEGGELAEMGGFCDEEEGDGVGVGAGDVGGGGEDGGFEGLEVGAVAFEDEAFVEE